MLPPVSKATFGIIIAIFASFVYGFAPSSTRSVYEHGGNAVFVILMVSTMRTIMFCAASLTHKRKLFAETSHIKFSISNGIFQAISSAAFIASMVYLPAPIAIIIFFTYPLMLYLFLVFKGKEELNAITLASVILTILGLALVIGLNKDGNTTSIIGIILSLVAAITTTSRIYALGNALKTRDPIIVATENYIMCLVFSLPFLLYQLPVAPDNIEGWMWAFVSGLSSTIGGFFMFNAIQRIGSFNFSFISKLEPIFATIIAALLINEILSVSQYIGIGIVVASLLFYQLQQTSKKEKATS